MNEKFEAAKRDAMAIDGMLSEFSMAAMDCLLSFQDEQGIAGNIVEFGVYKGRSAAILAHHARPTERLILVDIASYVERPKLERICPQLEFVLSSSERFKKTIAGYPKLKRSCRFLHVDSSHTFNATLAELELSEELIGEGGIVALDDYTNLDYSQIIAATFNYLYTRPTRLSIFLVTQEKAYLCRSADFQLYGEFVLRRLADEMAARGIADTCIARTDINPAYRAFNLRRRALGEEGKLFASNLYQAFYNHPAKVPLPAKLRSHPMLAPLKPALKVLQAAWQACTSDDVGAYEALPRRLRALALLTPVPRPLRREELQEKGLDAEGLVHAGILRALDEPGWYMFNTSQWSGRSDEAAMSGLLDASRKIGLGKARSLAAYRIDRKRIEREVTLRTESSS